MEGYRRTKNRAENCLAAGREWIFYSEDRGVHTFSRLSNLALRSFYITSFSVRNVARRDVHAHIRSFTPPREENVAKQKCSHAKVYARERPRDLELNKISSRGNRGGVTRRKLKSCTVLMADCITSRRQYRGRLPSQRQRADTIGNKPHRNMRL